jgi:hypothetical protein
MMDKNSGIQRSRNTLGVTLRTISFGALILLVAVIVRADTVLDWNTTALKTTAAAPLNPPLEARNLAIVHAAMFDAVNSILDEFPPYAVELRASHEASRDAAAAAAAHFALVQLYPAQQAMLDAAYVASLASIRDGAAKTAGIGVGEAAAVQILAMRATDGADAAIIAPYPPGSAPGDWIPTPPAFRPALDPGEGSAFPPPKRIAIPPRAAADIDQPAIHARLQRDQRHRIRDQQHPQAGSDRPGPLLGGYDGPQLWNPAARQVAIAPGLTLSQNARAFAVHHFLRPILRPKREDCDDER